MQVRMSHSGSPQRRTGLTIRKRVILGAFVHQVGSLLYALRFENDDLQASSREHQFYKSSPEMRKFTPQYKSQSGTYVPTLAVVNCDDSAALDATGQTLGRQGFLRDSDVSAHDIREACVSVSQFKDEEGTCACPLPSTARSGDLENKDPSSDCEPKAKMLKWSNRSSPLASAESDNYSKGQGARHSLIIVMRWWCSSNSSSRRFFSLEKTLDYPQIKHNPWVSSVTSTYRG
ncbi:inositol hexakisphosphate kinase 2-like protein [Lates japonicus]|uniref:Inositol hexakisphosphate kinase 2-like protein n=1 Tax=Lates japonicus TaxID=270547 RepID=A0AAD3N3Q5_LATJO|nr:inositol hexakisphosphate kinase 2-like protein [Lates japonicus]